MLELAELNPIIDITTRETCKAEVASFFTTIKTLWWQQRPARFAFPIGIDENQGHSNGLVISNINEQFLIDCFNEEYSTQLNLNPKLVGVDCLNFFSFSPLCLGRYILKMQRYQIPSYYFILYDFALPLPSFFLHLSNYSFILVHPSVYIVHVQTI